MRYAVDGLAGAKLLTAVLLQARGGVDGVLAAEGFARLHGGLDAGQVHVHAVEGDLRRGVARGADVGGVAHDREAGVGPGGAPALGVVVERVLRIVAVGRALGAMGSMAASRKAASLACGGGRKGGLISNGFLQPE